MRLRQAEIAVRPRAAPKLAGIRSERPASSEVATHSAAVTGMAMTPNPRSRPMRSAAPLTPVSMCRAIASLS